MLTAVSQIRDQGCQTKGDKAKFFVTALGELMRGNELLDCSTLNDLPRLAARYGLDWKKVSQYRHDGQSAGARRWREIVDAEFASKRALLLTTNESTFTERVYAFQDKALGGRFRVYGCIKPNYSQVIVFVTEFMGFVDDESLWEEVETIRGITKAHLWVMNETKHLDKSKKRGDKKWTLGPDHGRMERQVEFSWRIETMTVDEMLLLQRNVILQTQPIWDKAGVGVC